jgi:hypothetical protein
LDEHVTSISNVKEKAKQETNMKKLQAELTASAGCLLGLFFFLL